MELDPQSDQGKGLHKVLKNWTDNQAPAHVLDKFNRAVIGLSTEIENEDQFISALYGQSVLDKSPFILSQRVPTVFLRLQYGIEASLEKKCWKELIVALERSNNHGILTRLFNWAENNLNDVQQLGNLLLSHLSPGSLMTPRHREIVWNGEELERTVLEVCKNKIILGWNSGQIKIYSGDDLSSQTELNYCGRKARVTCLQCTCTEIIAGYSDGSICIWDITRETLVQTISVANVDSDAEEYATGMRWRDPKLVVTTYAERLKIWQYVNSTFTPLGVWDSEESYFEPQVDFNKNYIAFIPKADSIEVRYFNGNSYRSISSAAGNIWRMSLHEDRLITGGDRQVVQVWDINTGACLVQLEGHEDFIVGVDARDNVIASVDLSGGIILWNLKAALDGGQGKLATFTHPERQIGVDVEGIEVKLGTSVVVSGYADWRSRAVVVTDFPAPRIPV